MSRRNNNGSVNNENNTSGVYYDSELRGYSRRHSYYDNAFNMDFEYSYLDLMSSFGRFVSITHEMYSNMETCISTIIQLQNERRRLVNRRRERSQNNRDLSEQQQREQELERADDNDNDNDNDNASILEESRDSRGFHNAPNNDIQGSQRGGGVTNRGLFPETTINARDARDSRELNNNNNNNNTGTTRTTTGAVLPRRSLFDISSVFYSIPRTVLLNPTADTATSNRRRNGGLTISEVEENTEILMYGSIPSNYIVNTECPITRETFTPESVVLTLKQCKHCFVPFRMMTWLETNSTCPLCRSNVVITETTQTNTNNSNENNASNTYSATGGTGTTTTTTTTTTNNPYNPANICISNIFNNLMQNNNNEFNNLSIDNMSDDSIMFSFDLPTSQINRQTSENNTFIIPQIERLLADTLPVSIFDTNPTNAANATSGTSVPNNTDDTDNNQSNDYHYPEVD